LSNVTIKTVKEVDAIRAACQMAVETLLSVGQMIRPGITTEEIDRFVHEDTVRRGGWPAPLNYHGFPKSVCTSVNEVVCHGIPGERVLRAGDIVNIDVTVIKDGFHGDTSRMYLVGDCSVQARRLSGVAYDAMCRGIRTVAPGARLGDLGHTIQQFVESQGYSVVREYCGHGIGRVFHEDPQVLHYGEPGTGLVLEPGMTFTVEPMVNAGRRHVKLLGDGWTVVTKDHSLSAQWVHTCLVTETGVEVLTLGEGSKRPAASN